MGDLDQVYHDCSIRDDDLDFQSTIQSLKQMAAEYEDTRRAQTEAGSKLAAIMLRSELENVAAVLKDATGWEEPDFFALAYYLGHENRGSLREMENAQRNSYLVDYCGERFWNRFLELCRRAEAEQMVRFMTRKYIYNTEKPVKQLKCRRTDNIAAWNTQYNLWLLKKDKLHNHTIK